MKEENADFLCVPYKVSSTVESLRFIQRTFFSTRLFLLQDSATDVSESDVETEVMPVQSTSMKVL